MANQNDAKIKTLLSSIEQKKIQMGVKPKPAWLTNGVIEERNINTLTSIDACITITAQLIGKKEAHQKACEFLGIAIQDYGSEIEDALHDIKLRVQIIQWDLEKKKLNTLETQLKNLRSEDAKTEDALDDILKVL